MEIEWATTESFRRITVAQLRPILDVLVKIDWPCSASRIPVIMERLGWVFISDQVDAHSDTLLPFNYTVGAFSHPDGIFTRLGFPASDYVDSSDSVAIQAVRNAFPLVVRDMESILGPQSHTEADLSGVAWDLDSGGRVRLDNINIGLHAWVLSQDIADAERYTEANDMSDYYDDDE